MSVWFLAVFLKLFCSSAILREPKKKSIKTITSSPWSLKQEKQNFSLLLLSDDKKKTWGFDDLDDLKFLMDGVHRRAVPR